MTLLLFSPWDFLLKEKSVVDEWKVWWQWCSCILKRSHVHKTDFDCITLQTRQSVGPFIWLLYLSLALWILLWKFLITQLPTRCLLPFISFFFPSKDTYLWRVKFFVIEDQISNVNWYWECSKGDTLTLAWVWLYLLTFQLFLNLFCLECGFCCKSQREYICTLKTDLGHNVRIILQ